MKKLLFYLPAAVHTAATLCLNVLSGSLIPLWHIWNILFWLSGFLLARGRAWGCLLGLLPAAQVLYMNRQMGPALITGLVWTVYYLACGAWVLWAHRSKKH